MIVRGEHAASIECDAIGCNRSHAQSNSTNAVEQLLRHAAIDGWFVSTSGAKVLHLCRKCGNGLEGAVPLRDHIKPNGAPSLRGSQDVTGILSGVVTSSQTLQKQVVAREYIPAGALVFHGPDGTVTLDPSQQVKTPNRARAIRIGRQKDLERGTPGASEMSLADAKTLAEKLKKADKLFKVTIRLREGKPQ